MIYTNIILLFFSFTYSQPDMTVLFQYFDQSVDIYVDGDQIVITGDGVPSHLSPYFPETYNDSQNGLYFFEDLNGDGINDWYVDPNNGMNVNPNRIGEQDYNFRIPLYPEINLNGPTDTFLGAIGVSLNGVPLYNEYEGPVAQLDPQTILSFDLAQGHPAPGGLYHYHFPPESLFVATEDNFIGFAADGFPVYGPKNQDGFNVENLDDYHAEYGPTPDFPDSIYHYHTNYTAPYIIGAFAGAIGTGFGGGGGGGGGGGDNGPELISFFMSEDTVNTSTSSSEINYSLEAYDNDDFLMDYSVRLILNGGPMNGGEIFESNGQFNNNVNTQNINGLFTLPLLTTEGSWNIRIILTDNQNNVTNLSPNNLGDNGFQNTLVVNNSIILDDPESCILGDVYVSEGHTSGDPEDYIELYNSGDEDCSLKGFQLDDSEELDDLTFGDVIIPAGGYWFGYEDADSSFSSGLSGSGDLIVFADSTGSSLIVELNQTEEMDGISLSQSFDADGNGCYTSPTPGLLNGECVTLSLGHNSSIPVDYSLSQNYPNPFNPLTRIAYSLPKESIVSIYIYDVKGFKVKSLVNKNMNAGNHSFVWDSTNDRGDIVSTGIYFFTLQTSEFTSTQKMLFLK